MYAIVKFLDEGDAPGIVCSHWIKKDKSSCVYPNVRTNEARDKLLRKLTQPSQDWISCRIKILHEYGSFSEAVVHLAKAEETSNLDSSDDDESFTRCRLRKKKRFPTCEDEDGESDCGISKKSKNVLYNDVQIDPYPTPTPTARDKSSFIATNNEVPDLQPTVSISSQPLNSSLLLENSPASSSSQTVLNGRLIAWMGDVSSKLQTLCDRIERVEKNQEKMLNTRAVPENEEQLESYHLLGNLPVNDETNFEDFNQKISEEKQLRHLLIKVFMSVGGKDLRTHIHNMMRRLITDDVAELYSLTGKSTLKDTMKKSFLATEASKAIFSACQRCHKMDATDVKIKEALGDWLNQAKVRKTRRMQRQMLKNSENTNNM